jgi:membrane-bound serine protease (ClpP class)
VAVWVGPSGARAASAGAFIAAAAPYVLMASGTNIGSATPVGLDGGDLSDKVVNDAAASIAALAEATGHNPAAYRAMVTDAANLTAREAVAADVADALAESRDDAIAWLDGRPDGDGGTIATAGAAVVTDTMPWYLEGLQAITNPNLVFLLLIAGLVGLMIEALAPGGIIPGVVGLIALLLGLAGLSALPFNWIGVALIALGVGLLFAETQVPGFGALAIGGVVALSLGGVFLFGSGDDGVSTSPWIVVPLAVGIGAGGIVAARRVVAAQRNRPATGVETLVGLDAVAAGAVDAAGGQVLVNGERWAARASAGDRFEAGAPLRVVRVDTENLVVTVEPRPHKEA